MSDTEATNAAAATNEEEKKHDVDYADEEAKNAVSINPTETKTVERSENQIRDNQIRDWQFYSHRFMSVQILPSSVLTRLILVSFFVLCDVAKQAHDIRYLTLY